MNLRSVSFECKCKLEEIKDDYKIEVSEKRGFVQKFWHCSDCPADLEEVQ